MYQFVNFGNFQKCNREKFLFTICVILLDSLFTVTFIAKCVNLSILTIFKNATEKNPSTQSALHFLAVAFIARTVQIAQEIPVGPVCQIWFFQEFFKNDQNEICPKKTRE
jgi:hypothetical protein